MFNVPAIPWIFMFRHLRVYSQPRRFSGQEPGIYPARQANQQVEGRGEVERDAELSDTCIEIWWFAYHWPLDPKRFRHSNIPLWTLDPRDPVSIATKQKAKNPKQVRINRRQNLAENIEWRGATVIARREAWAYQYKVKHQPKKNKKQQKRTENNLTRDRGAQNYTKARERRVGKHGEGLRNEDKKRTERWVKQYGQSVHRTLSCDASAVPTTTNYNDVEWNVEPLVKMAHAQDNKSIYCYPQAHLDLVWKRSTEERHRCYCKAVLVWKNFCWCETLPAVFTLICFFVFFLPLLNFPFPIPRAFTFCPNSRRYFEGFHAHYSFRSIFIFLVIGQPEPVHDSRVSVSSVRGPCSAHVHFNVLVGLAGIVLVILQFAIPADRSSIAVQF